MKEKKYKIYLTDRELLTIKVLVIGKKETVRFLTDFGTVSSEQEATEDFYDNLLKKLNV